MMRQADEFWWGRGKGGDKGEALLPALWHTQTSRSSGVQLLVLTFKCSKKKRKLWLRVTHGSDSKTLKVTECSGEEERSARWPETCLGPLTFALQGACLWKVESFWAFFFLPSCSSVFLLKAKFRASTVRVLVYIQWNWYTLVSLLKSSLWKVTWASIFQSWYVSFLTQDLGLLLYSRLSLGDEGRKEAICLSRFLWNCC